jgi:hypothetical protein
VFVRLIALADLQLRDEIRFDDFVNMSAVGLVAVAVVLALGVSQDGLSFPKALLLSTLAIAHAQPVKMLFYPMASVSAIYVVIFALCFFLCLKNPTPTRSVLALIFYGLGVMTLSSALFLPIFGVFALAVRKKYGSALVYAFIGIAVAALYFLHYRSGSASMRLLIEQPLTVILFWLSLLASAFEPTRLPAGLAYVSIGFGLFAFFLFVATIRLWRENLFAFLVLAYCVFTSLLIAVGRSQKYGDAIYSMAFDGRYRIYSTVFVAAAACTVYLLIQRRAVGRHTAIATYMSVTLGLGVMSFLSYQLYPPGNRGFVARRLQPVQDLESAPLQPSPSGAQLRPEWVGFLRDAIKAGIYHPPISR